MSPLRRGRASGAVVSVEDLLDATQALRSAVRSGGAELPGEPRRRAEQVTDKVRERLSLTGGHTVVALAGATGSGKSSLFNALAGSQVAKVGAIRPTTSTPTAATWGEEPVGDLLDWLGVATRHHVEGSGGLAGTSGPLDGLVLLDLPDFDSRESANRAEAERVLELVDLFVWVTDPQKYADARLHDDYVAALSHHGAVTLAVLNQVDRLTPAEVEMCLEDLDRLMARDGLPDATVLPVSAATGEGLDVLRQRLTSTVAGQAAARTRLLGDVRTSARTLRRAVSDTESPLEARQQTELVDALARSAGVPTVVDAVERDYRMESVSHTGWPFTRWVNGLRAKPLRRLRLGREDVAIDQADLRAVLGRSSIPPPSPAARAAVQLATRHLADTASTGLPTPWADAVDDAVTPPGEQLTDALDQAVVATPLRGRDPLWWSVGGFVQLLLALAAVTGVVWYVVLLVLGWLQFPAPDPPLVAGWLPVPFVLLVVGIVGGLLLAVLARWVAGRGARRRGAAGRSRLREAVAEVAEEHVVAPVRAVLERHRETRQHLDAALGD